MNLGPDITLKPRKPRAVVDWSKANWKLNNAQGAAELDVTPQAFCLARKRFHAPSSPDKQGGDRRHAGTVVVKFRCSPNDKRRWQVRAKSAGVKWDTWVKQQLEKH